MRGFSVDCVAGRDFTQLHKMHTENARLGSYTARDFKCQYDSKIDSVACTCKSRRKDYYNTSRQVYRSQRYLARDHRDIGIGSVKTVYKKRVRRVYLPATEDRGIGSADLSSFIRRRRKNRCSGYYEVKKTSSKCVGGLFDSINTSLVDKKISPIIQTVSGCTSPKSVSKTVNNLKNNMSKTRNKKKIHKVDCCKETQGRNSQKVLISAKNEIKPVIQNSKDNIRNFSSDSLVQHIYNLENTSDDKIRTSTDFIENKLEKEYREIFTTRNENNTTTQDNPITNIKSTSFIRKRFMALRKFGQKEDTKTESDTLPISNKVSVPSLRDVSIASDPPSLEARSYSDTKIYSPITSFIAPCDEPLQNSSDKKNANRGIAFNAHNDVNSEHQDVQGMFKLWEEKFNFKNDKNISPSTSISKKQNKKVKLDLSIQETRNKTEKKGRRFLFFGRKKKDKNKQLYKSKQGVTAGRCELGDGLMIKIGGSTYTPKLQNTRTNSYDYSISRKDWFQRYLTNDKDSRNSVRIRWNNSLYTTSSSTVFELLDCVYKNTGIILSSKSEISTEASSYYHSFVKPQVNFMQQNIQAWMMPNTITDIEKTGLENSLKMVNPKKKEKENKIEITFPNKKCFIEKSKVFAEKIELVLHSKNIVTINNSKSSEYIVIDIPMGYFSDTSTDSACETSDEKVYNIIEYEPLRSNSYVKKKNIESIFHTGHGTIQDQINILCPTDEHSEGQNSFKEKLPASKNIKPNSSAYLPQGCDFISVGIITQRDIRDTKKSILKANNDTDEESTHALPTPKTCEFAESFLQDYCRNWAHVETDLLPWCLSEIKLRRPSEINSMVSFNEQGDGSKSCSNIYDQGSTIVSSCETSSCSHCIALEEGKKAEDSKTTKFFNKFMKKNNEQSHQTSNERRVWPKDSLEVFKRRKIYAASNKSKWGMSEDICETYPAPRKSYEQILAKQPKVEKTSSDGKEKNNKLCKKRVLLPDCDVMEEVLKEQLSDIKVEGILTFKGAKGCDNCENKSSQHSKQAHIVPHPVKEIPQPSCKDSCIKINKPPCSKKNSPTCNVPPPPLCPEGPPSPCQKPCPPSPPPCSMIPPCVITPPQASLPKFRSNSTQHDYRKLISPRIHSPIQSSPKRSRLCVCPKKRLANNKCQITKKPLNTSTLPHMSTSSSRETILKRNSGSSCKCCKSRSSEKSKTSSGHEFPWPLKNQLSNAPSKESVVNQKKGLLFLEKTSSKCINAIKRLIDKISSSSMKQKSCKPDCANRRLFSNLAPPSEGFPDLTPSNKNKTQPKMAGLHLKKLPMPKSSSKDCSFEVDKGDGVIRLNSREKITIKLKQSTPSTEEIREGCNIKVQDEDGQTLYERRDYRKNDGNRMQFVKDMYKDSRVVQRLSTPNIDTVLDEKSAEIKECNSDLSVSNVIEINLNLKFKQGDKTTELNIIKDGNSLKKELDSCAVHDQYKSDNEIYNVKENQKESNDNTEKQDVNVKIMIKNYTQPVKSLKTNKHSISLSADDFSKKISEKFQTVSTGYSDTIERQTYSIHQATTGLANSINNKKSLSNVSLELSSKIFSGTVQNYSTEKDYSISRTATKSETKIDSSIEKIEIINERSVTSFSLTNEEYTHSDDTNLKDKSLGELKKYNRDNKKKILKKIFEKASEIRNNKNKMQEIKHLLRAILTSDSSIEAFEPNNKLTKDVIYSLKSDCNDIVNFDYTDNTSNSTKISSRNLSEVVYQTKEISSDNSESSGPQNGCLCTHLATKLNVSKNTCCCRKYNIDEEVACDLINKSRCVNVETQYSDYKKEKKMSHNSAKIGTQKLCRPQIKNLNASNSKLLQSCSDIVNKNSNPDIKLAHILQLNETKKAVLEIYTEKNISGERKIAKLPKFIYGIEKQSFNFEELYNEKSFVMSTNGKIV